MSHCQRCGATNEPTGRFCVACGSPLGSAAAPWRRSPRRSVRLRCPQDGNRRGMESPRRRRRRRAALPPRDRGHSAGFRVRIRPNRVASDTRRVRGFSSATCRGAGSRERDASQQLAAAAGLIAAVGGPPPGFAQYPSAVPSAAYAPGVQPSTAAMPGVSQDPETISEGAPRLLAGFIVTYDSHALGRFWPLYQGKNRIGRQGSGAELDVELDHPTASSRHAVIYASACPGRIKLEDTGSTNGTLINGARLPPGTRHELNDGDRVRFGLLSTIVKIV